MTRRVWMWTAALAAVLVLGTAVAVPMVQAATTQQVRQTRPVELGTSGGNVNEVSRRGCSSGTLGALVTDGTKQYVLSNNHVLARENKAAAGEDISQPGLIDAACRITSTDVVAALTRFIPIGFGKRGGNNAVDAAIAETRSGAVKTDGSILGVGTVSNLTANATVGCAVRKVGRTTGDTSGAVSATNATVNVRYSSGTATFTDQILVTPGTFSAGGDSGSLIVRDGTNPRPVGLLFAGSSSYTIANPIGVVLGTLAVSMVGSGDGSTGDCLSGGAASASGQSAAQNAKSRAEQALLNLPDVAGVAVGANGTILVLLENDNAQTRRQIPPQVDNVPVQVQVTGAFEAR